MACAQKVRSARQTVTNKNGTRAKNSNDSSRIVSPKRLKLIFLACISMASVVWVYPLSSLSLTTVANGRLGSSSSTSSGEDDAATMLQYLDPEAVREAQRIQDDFCKSMSSSSSSSSTTQDKVPLIADIPAGSIHTKQVGFQMHHHGKKDAVSSSIMRTGGWEVSIIRNLIENIEIYARERKKEMEDLTFVDIGANIGWYSMAIASLGVNVVAFEPMAPNLELFRRDLCTAAPEIRDHITLFGHGLSDKEQTCFQYVTHFNRGNGIMRCVEREEYLNLNLGKFRVVGKSQLRVLDNIIRTVPKSDLQKEEGNGNTPLAIAALKIDTEGFEPIVFNGGRTLLSQAKIPVIFAEYTPARVSEISPEKTGFDYLKYFYDSGYVVYNNFAGSPWTLIPNMTVARAYEWPRESDIVAVHKSFRNISTMAGIARLPGTFVAEA
jgi:FkbM family methyltransferase